MDTLLLKKSKANLIAGGVVKPSDITTGVIQLETIGSGGQKPVVVGGGIVSSGDSSGGGSTPSTPYKKQYKYMLTKGYNCVQIDLPFIYDNTCSTTVYFNSGLTSKSTEGNLIMLNGNDLTCFNGLNTSYTFSPQISNRGSILAKGSNKNASAEQTCYLDLSLSSLKYGVKDVDNYLVSFKIINSFECTYIRLFGDPSNKVHEKTQFMGGVVKQGDEIKYNLIPVQDMDGVDCWFDTVNSEFYYPTGSGEHYFQGTDELIY